MSSMGFLGAGQMATALARGFIRAGLCIPVSAWVSAICIVIIILCVNIINNIGFVRQQDITASATSLESSSLKNIKVGVI